MEEHSTLRLFRSRWLGKTVTFDGDVGIVIGVGDDGYMCEWDLRRRAKPTGLLFIRTVSGKDIERFDFECSISSG